VDDVLRQVFDAGEPVVVRMRHEPHAAAQRLLVGLGAGWIVDPTAPPCVRQCGQKECRVSARMNERVAAVPLSMASLGSGGQQTWEANWIDYRSSVANVERRRDRGDVPTTCDACGCETDITPAPHSPKCPTLHRDDWKREGMLQAVETWAVGHDDEPPVASDWPQETSSHPSARQAVVEFGSWGGFLEAAGFSANTPRRRGRRLGPPVVEDGRELLDRMDAGEPLNDDTGLEEAAAVGKRAVSGSAMGIGEPERAATSSSPQPEPELEEASEPNGAGSGVSSSPEPGAVEPAQTPADDGAVDGLDLFTVRRQHGRAPKWTREKVVAAIREVAEQVGHTPTGNDMRAAGLGGAYQVSTFERLDTSWQELVREAGYEPRVRGANTKWENGRPQAASVDLGRAASWTADEVLDAIRRWAVDHGQPPTSDDWTPRVDGYPSAATAARRFGSWAEAVERAGFDRPARGGHTRQPVEPPVRRVRVRGTGLTYRTPEEAYVAADEIEADGERVADQARFDGNETKAEQAIDQSRELAEKIRVAAAAFEERGGGTRSGREPSAARRDGVEAAADDATVTGDEETLRGTSDPSRPDARLLGTTDDMPPFQRALARALIAGMRAAADALEQELA
jgi:hypothetical protein